LTTARVASFFAGIGGFDRAFEQEGAEVVFQCEKDKFCRSVLARHWPDTKSSADIRGLKPAEVPAADVWTAGFPCQDVSLARGNHGRTGLRGNHTSLFFALADLLKAKKPEVVLLENVVGLLNSHKGHDFAVILRELTSQGYAVSWRVMNARYFGAPQSRGRVFLCAWKGNYRQALRTLFEDTAAPRPGPERTAFLTEQRHKATGATVAKIAYCVSATSGRHTGLDWARSYVSYADRVRRPTPTESERLQGFPTDWTLPASDYKPPARGLDSERYKAAGNAVAVPVVRWIAKRLLQRVNEPPAGEADDFRAGALEHAPDLRNETSWLDFAHIEEGFQQGQFVHRWKAGGCAFGDLIVEGKASPAPVVPVEPSFVEVLDKTVPDDRYFLTGNAAIGILRRADAEGRNLFPPMRRALEILAKKVRFTSSGAAERMGGPVVKTGVCQAGAG
jgi:DNA (cytosine-5)-methyltransferase 1